MRQRQDDRIEFFMSPVSSRHYLIAREARQSKEGVMLRFEKPQEELAEPTVLESVHDGTEFDVKDGWRPAHEAESAPKP